MKGRTIESHLAEEVSRRNASTTRIQVKGATEFSETAYQVIMGVSLNLDPKTSFMSRRNRVIKKIDKAYVRTEFRTVSPQYYVGRNRSCR